MHFTRFLWRRSIENFSGSNGMACFTSIPVLHFGLACCPRIFTKLMKPVFSELRKMGFDNVPYIDDIYLQGDSAAECWVNCQATAKL